MSSDSCCNPHLSMDHQDCMPFCSIPSLEIRFPELNISKGYYKVTEEFSKNILKRFYNVFEDDEYDRNYNEWPNEQWDIKKNSHT